MVLYCALYTLKTLLPSYITQAALIFDLELCSTLHKIKISVFHKKEKYLRMRNMDSY